MKILLIYPYPLENRVHEADVRVMPMGLFSIAAVLLEAGHHVELLNGFGLDRAPDQVRTLFAERAPDVIGFSVLNANRWGAVEMARMAKSVLPGGVVVFGGVAATHLWRHFLTHFPEVDYTVMGEGETPFRRLIECLESGDLRAIDTLPGVGCRKDGGVVGTAPGPPIDDLDRLPHPARYFTYQHVSLTRGCPSDCAFCGSPKFWGRRVRFHSADYFVEELRLLNAKGVDFFYVSDDTFTLNRKRVMAVCRKIVDTQLRINWAAISRVDCVDQEVLCWMRRAGCVQISYGIESGSPRMRAVYNKPMETDRIQQAFQWTIRAGIFPRAYFIYGGPGETPETIQETLELMDVIQPLGAIFYVLAVFPGTALYADYSDRFGVDDDIWLERIEDILYYERDPALSRQQVLAFGKTLREAFYKRLPQYALSIELTEDNNLDLLNADFLSRLAMTFSHGEYARIDAIPNRAETALTLYKRALSLYPDHRAFWGLSHLHHAMGDPAGALEICGQGLAHYPDSTELNLCKGVSLMNLGRFEEALTAMGPFGERKPFLEPMKECRRALDGSRLPNAPRQT